MNEKRQDQQAREVIRKGVVMGSGKVPTKPPPPVPTKRAPESRETDSRTPDPAPQKSSQ